MKKEEGYKKIQKGQKKKKEKPLVKEYCEGKFEKESFILKKYLKSMKKEEGYKKIQKGQKKKKEKPLVKEYCEGKFEKESFILKKYKK